MLRAVGTHNQFSRGAPLDADVGGSIGQHTLRAVIDGKAEFCRQAARACLKRLLELRRKRSGLIACSRERRNQDVTSRFRFGIRIEQAQPRELFDEGRMTFVADAPDLEVGPARQIDQAVAIPLRKLRDAVCLRRIEPAGARAHANHKPVA